jgi:hypothetical protein
MVEGLYTIGGKGKKTGAGLASLRLPEHADLSCLQGNGPDGQPIILAFTTGIIVPGHQGSTGRLVQQA